MFKKIAFVFSLLGVILVACGGDSTPTPNASAFPQTTATIERAPTRNSLTSGSSVPPPKVTGKFTFAPGDGSIWLQDPADGKPHPILKPTAELFADAPDFSPDGTHIVYIRSSLTAQGAAKTTVQIMRADGTDDHTLVEPPDRKTTFNWPTYSPDGKWIYYTASYPVPPDKQHSEIQRVPLESGTPQTVINDARSPTVSPDGTKLAFMRFNFETFSAGLWIADSDGQNARPLLADDVFIIVAAPQFSPDGTHILFTASGPNSRPLPGVSQLTPGCKPFLLCLFAQPAYADGLPWDLWMVTSDGSKFTRLTKVGADSPWAAWSRDGKQIIFFDTSGVYLLDVASEVIAQVNRNGGHGVFDWWQKS